jgi:D-alanine-D-alanine ligase
MPPAHKKSDAQVAALTAKHIEIVRSTQPWLSSISQPSSDAILAVLSKHYASVGVTIVNNLLDLRALIDLSPDLVFLGVKFVPLEPFLGRHSPRIWLADYLDKHNIAYTGSSGKAHELELDKQLAKARVLQAGLRTSNFCVVRQHRELATEKLGLDFPLFVKPNSAGGGLGVDSESIVNNYYELRAKVQSIATKFRSHALVEEYLPGREFSVAILQNEATDELATMPIELIAPVNKQGERLLSGKVKSANAEQVLPLADDDIRPQVTALALNAFSALGARDYGRIDIRLDSDDVPHFLEANLLPSLIDGYGSFPKACAMNIGLGYEEMILTITRLGLGRQRVIDNGAELGELDALATLATAF